MKTQEFYWEAQRRNWQPSDMGTMSSWAGVAIYSEDAKSSCLWPWDAETCIKFDQSALCYSARASHVCLSESSETMRRWGGRFVVYAVCLVSDSNMSEDLTDTEWWFGKCTINPETRIWTHIEKKRRQRGQWLLLCNKNVVTWVFPQTNSSCFASDQLHVFVFCFL